MAYKTEDNLQIAFSGECQAYRRYRLYAEKAEQEGYPQLGKLFRAVADAEAVHARNHYTVMDAVGTTQENLLAAVIGEHQEFTGMYPIFIEDAKREQNERASRSFTWANEVEKVHHDFFEQALATVKAGETPEDATYYVCMVCGNMVTGAAPDTCPICGAAGDTFNKVV